MAQKKLRFNVAVTGLIAGAFIIAGALNPALSAAAQQAVCINAAADYTSGAFSVISTEPVGGPRDIENDINPTISDLGLDAYGRYFYVIERATGENITKYAIDNPKVPIWQFSARDDADTVASVNPHSIVFASPTKAYLMRNNTSVAWIINPEAKDVAEFKTGTLDLSAYNDQDELGPEMTAGVVVGNKLFILMQRLNQNDSWIPNEAYVAVFDTTTDQEITTSSSTGMKGILLPVKNPSAITYEPVSGMIYVLGQGKFESSWSGTQAEYSGGIATIDPDTYETILLLDDGDDTAHPYGNFSGMTILSLEKGYFVGYAGWGDNTLYEFNPSTGEVIGVVNDHLQNKNIAGMEAGAAGDDNGLLWVTNSTDAEIVIIDPADNSIDETIGTNLNPKKIVFVSDEILQVDLNRNDLSMSWFFQGDVANYTLLYAFPPLTAESEIFYLDLANMTQLSLPGLPEGLSVMAAVQATGTDGSVTFSNIADVVIPPKTSPLPSPVR